MFSVLTVLSCLLVYKFILSGIIEEEGVYVRFVKNDEPVTKFAGVESPETVDAAGLYEPIKNRLYH